MFLVVAQFIWRFKELIALAAVLLCLGGLYWRYDYVTDRYEEQKQEVAKYKDLYETEKQQNVANQIEWNRQVKNRERQLEEASRVKKEIVKKEKRRFDDVFTQIGKDLGELHATIPQVTKPNDVVVAPDSLRVFYDRASAVSANIAAGREDYHVPVDTARITGKAETFEAAAFTSVVNGNHYQCLLEQLQLNSLITIVEKLEAENARINAGGPNGTP